MNKCTIPTIIVDNGTFWRNLWYICTENLLFMPIKTKALTPSFLLEQTGASEEVFVSEDIAILHSLGPLKDSSATDILHTPQYVELGRIVLVTKGTATHHINLVPFETQAGDVLVIPQNNFISISSLSNDYDGQMISFGRLPVDFEKGVRLRLSENDFGRMRHYAELLWEIVHSPYDRRSIEHMETALLYDLKRMHEHQSSVGIAAQSRGQQLFQRFLEALGRKGSLPRTVKAYADSLCVSPNHLSSVVREQSGRSVMDWLNAHCILRAQVLLRHTDFPIYEIADQLGFQSATFFSRFFRRETGITPKEYRAGKQRSK